MRLLMNILRTFPSDFVSRKIEWGAWLSSCNISLDFRWVLLKTEAFFFDYTLNVWTFPNMPASLLRCGWAGDSMEFNHQLKRKNPTMTSFVGISVLFLFFSFRTAPVSQRNSIALFFDASWSSLICSCSSSYQLFLIYCGIFELKNSIGSTVKISRMT